MNYDTLKIDGIELPLPTSFATRRQLKIARRNARRCIEEDLKNKIQDGGEPLDNMPAPGQPGWLSLRLERDRWMITGETGSLSS